MDHHTTTFQPFDWIAAELAAFEAAGLGRRRPAREGLQAVQCRLDGRDLVNFGSNDYLSLAGDPRLGAAVAAAISKEGWGSGASPLLGGLGASQSGLEQSLADFEGTEAALVFASGFAANSGTIAALVGPGDAVFTDSTNHASLLDGCRLSRADVRVYPHSDCQRLEQLLQRSAHRRRLIVTDTLFSMDGDLAPLAQLATLARQYGAMLMVDEAHATGVFGQNGRGVAELLGVEGLLSVRVGTLSKALGSIGGFVAGSRSLVQWLIHRARPYVFSTSPPAAVAAAGLAALDIIRQEPQRREQLLTRAAALRSALAGQGWNVGRSASQIIPVVVGEPQRAVDLSLRLAEAGLYVPAIRPPTVAEGEARLRISLAFDHTQQMCASLVAALGRARDQVC